MGECILQVFCNHSISTFNCFFTSEIHTLIFQEKVTAQNKLAETSKKACMTEVAADLILHKTYKACISILQMFKC